MSIIINGNNCDDDFFKKGKSGFNSDCGCETNCSSTGNQCCPTNTALPSLFCNLLQELRAGTVVAPTVMVLGNGGRIYVGTITDVQSNYFVLSATDGTDPAITTPTNVYIPFTGVESIVPLP